MKLTILALSLTLSFSAVGQTPTIKAWGGSAAINWAEEKKEADADSSGPGFFYHDCAQGVSVISASSTLAPQGTKNYSVNNLTDGDPMTAWVPKTGSGIGEYFEIQAQDVNTIYNGYQSSPSSWKNNSRVKKFKIYRNDTFLCVLELSDKMGSQRFELPDKKEFNEQNRYIFKFEIVEIYKGLKWPDVAISHVDYELCCFAENTSLLSNSDILPISKVLSGQNISNVDINSGETSNTEIVKTAKVSHLSLLKISTSSKQIEVTPDHPLYIKDIGFISISKTLQIKGLKNYEELINKIEILTWNNTTKKLEFEKLSDIQLIHGYFETYAILKLKKGNTYIANGFVTKTY